MIAWFAKNDIAANLLLISLLLWGLWSAMTQVTYEVFPDAEIDTINISVPFRGATPGEVEEGILLPIEEAIQDIESIKEIVSSASEGNGNVFAELKPGFPARDALDDIKSRVDAITNFPLLAEPPTVSLQQRTDSVVKVIISGDLEEHLLREVADEVYDEITSLTAISEMPRWVPFPESPLWNSFRRTETVSSASFIGARPYEIAIEVPESTLLRYDITLDEVANAVASQSVDLSGGLVKSSAGEILLRTKNKAYTGQEFEEIVIRANPDGTKVTVRDLGVVLDGFEEAKVDARFNGDRAVLISVNRVGDQNAILISNAVTAYVDRKSDSLPTGVTLTAWRDRSSIVKGRLQTLWDSASVSFFLVFASLALFLRFSLGAWVIAGLPVAFAGALILLPVLGASINIASLFGFILVLGIVVDDAIVTGENIFNKLKTTTDPTQAAIEGTHEVAVPVTLGVLTTAVAFLPLTMMPGGRGAMFSQITAVVVPVLIFSLVESKLILPAHLKHLKPQSELRPARWNLLLRGQQAFSSGVERFVARFYQPFLSRCLRERYITASVFFLLLLVTLGWITSGRIIFTPFPRVASEFVTARLTMPPGTPYEVTARQIDRMEQAAFELQKKYLDSDGNSLIEHVFSSRGATGIASSGGPRGRSPASGVSNAGEVSFEIIAPENRAQEVSGPQLAGEWRGMIDGIPGVEELNFKAEIGRYGDPIDIQLRGENPTQLSAAADDLKQLLAEYPALFDISSNVDDGKEEIQVTIKPQSEILGVDTSRLAQQVRGAFFGFEAQRLQRGRDDVRVMVRYPREERESLGNLAGLRIRTDQGARVPFASIAQLDFARSPSRIQRIDRNRTVNVVADGDKDQSDLEAIKASLSEEIAVLLAKYPDVDYTLEGEERERQEANQALGSGMFFVLLVIYCMLAIPFRSYFQPLMVMMVIPYGVIGAVIGHLIMGHSLSFMSLFGMLALSGVVVNDSLVLVDWINRRRREGMSLADAVLTGGGARFRPIILTSLTTFVGLMPLLSETSTQAQFLIPMAISLGFGILFATAITLILIPVSYLILEDLKSVVIKAWHWYSQPLRGKTA